MNAAKKLAIPALLLLAACSTHVGRDFDLAAFDAKVKRGATTQADVRDWLGAPGGVGVSVDSAGERFEEWSYYYAQGRFTSMSDARLKTLQVKFDQRGVVRAYNWSGERK